MPDNENPTENFGSTARPVVGWLQAPTPTGASHQCEPTLHRHPERQADFHRPRLFARGGQSGRGTKIAGETIVVAVSQKPTVPLPKRSKPVIPDTKNALPTMACVSAMQKSIRRGLEREAMEHAVELMHTSKAFHTMVCNRLIVICHEDLDTLAAPWVVPFVATALAQSQERYAAKKIGEARLMVGNAIRMMARAPKSRAGTHFAAAIGLRSLLEESVPGNI